MPGSEKVTIDVRVWNVSQIQRSDYRINQSESESERAVWKSHMRVLWLTFWTTWAIIRLSSFLSMRKYIKLLVFRHFYSAQLFYGYYFKIYLV